MTTVGELNQIPGKFVVEWRTKEFLSLSPETDKFYDSLEFSFGGTRWCLRIYPNGKTKSVTENGNVVNSEGYIHLYLRRVSTGPPINMTYSLGLKTLDEGVNPERHYTHSFKGIEGYGSQGLITRSEFLERKCELLSSGVLTVVCKMKYSKSGDISNSLLTVTSRTSDSTIQIFSMTTVGELNQIPGKFVVEWRTKEFLSLSPETDKFYDSLEFSFGGTRWCLRIYPNGKTKSVAENGNVVNSEGYIHLYLRRVSTGPPINMTYSLGLKTLDEGVNPERHYTHSFKGIEGYGSQHLITRSEFLERKCELLSSGVLTVVCKMKYSKSGDISSNTAAEKCSYCKSTLNANEDLSFHQQKCMDKPIKCPECSDVIALKNWYDHQCQKTGAEASEKLSSDFKTLMLSGDHSDIVIKVKKEEFQLHRSILAARNPYFDSMLKNIMKKKVTGIVTINDCEPDTFRSFIHFVYTGKVDEFSLENVCGLYEAADKYQEDQLKNECLHFMMNNLSVDSFCDYFAVALRHNEKELFQKAVELFTTKGKEIARSVKWQAFVQKHPIQANELFIKTLDHYIK